MPPSPIRYPLAVEPYTPQQWFALGKADPAFRTKPQIALERVDQALAQQWPCRAVVADSFYGEHHGFTAGLQARGVPYVVALKPSHAWWAPVAAVGAVWEVASAGGWVSPEQPGAWVAVERSFRDGHTTIWWGLEGVAGPYGPGRGRRLVIATPDPATLPEAATWYLATTLPLAAASLAEVVRRYGWRSWVEQQDKQDKQVKQSLGWSQYQVRSDRAIRRHWALGQCAFAFCWWAAGQQATTTVCSAASRPPTGPVGQDLTGRGKMRPAATPRADCPPPSWPVARRRVRAWLEPAHLLWRCWRAWSDQPPPSALQALLDWLLASQPLLLDDTS